MNDEKIQATWIKKSNNKMLEIEKVRMSISERINVESLSIGFLNELESFSLEYHISCDKTFENQEFIMKCIHYNSSSTSPVEINSLYLTRENDGWMSNRNLEMHKIANTARFVDISSTPLTNYFPINEMLRTKSKKETFGVIYINIPTLEISILNQTYKLISSKQFRYVNEKSKYECMIDVDNHGLVEKYDNLWEGTIEN